MTGFVVLLAVLLGLALSALILQRMEIERIRDRVGTPPPVRVHRTPQGEWTIYVDDVDDVNADTLEQLARFLEWIKVFDLP